MKKSLMVLPLALLAACFTEGGGNKPNVKSFRLTYCNSDKDCGSDFQCSPVYCPDKCIPGSDGKCLPCNNGYAGRCLPRPDTPCAAVTCPAGQVCKELCTGLCDIATMECKDVACTASCVPDQTGCSKDSDCKEGYHCEVSCARCGPTLSTPGEPAAASEPVRCIGDDSCVGYCVKNPEGCDFDKDCGEGFVCEPVMCAEICISDGKGGCLPCNGGHYGQCLPVPTTGCKSDAECGPGKRCQEVCMGWCDAFASSDAPDSFCKSECYGECVAQGGDCGTVKCPVGTECQVVCSACAGEAEKAYRAAGSEGAGAPAFCGECAAQCVPVGPPVTACDKNEECPPGMHCEPVYCALVCQPDGAGGCLPCNGGKLGECVPNASGGCLSDADCKPGERCETMCMHVCEPSGGCYGQCTGTCVPAVGGCESDADCGPGQRCEQVCTVGCATPEAAYGGASEPSFAPKDCGGGCFGQCVDVVEPKKCDTDADCGPGFVCVPVYCADYGSDKCYSDGKGGCGPLPPCNGGYFGECVPTPITGCKVDSDCKPGEMCQVHCLGFCPPGAGCAQECKGECVPKQAGCGPDQPCPPGFECQMMCPDCGIGQDCLAPCFGQCVPVSEPLKCNSDAECGPGFHCELVFCTMECAAPNSDRDPVPPCLPCNDGYLGVCTPDSDAGCKADSDCAQGETCEIYCTGVCSPSGGCKQSCFGLCVEKTKGCTSDVDCGKGFVCETVCPPCGGGFSSSNAAPPAPCSEDTCYGQCVPKKAPCGPQTPCPQGQVCQEKADCPPCVYAAQPCDIACIMTWECVPAPEKGCKGDKDCPSGKKCMVACPMTCSAYGCSEECQGVCI